ncbi:MAG: c-type cytochrome [Bosea sp. (in: a-proteobacteria)]
MIRMLVVAAVAVVGVTAAVAQGSPIEQRKALLKTFGAAVRDPGLMMRGEQPFDLAKVQASLKVFAEGSPKLIPMFPANSQTGDTKALPAIWTEQDKFNAIFTKLAADSTAAMTSIKDEASFKTEMPKVLGNCGACHNAYRAK